MIRPTDSQGIRRPWRRLLAGAAVLACLQTGCNQFLDREPVRLQVKLKKYSFDPPVIRVKQGDVVELEVSTSDVQHGFAIPELDVREPVPRGHMATVRFKAEEKGQFKIQCSILCGPGHDEMQGTLIVE